MKTKYYDFNTLPDWLAEHIEGFVLEMGDVKNGEQHIINNIDEGLRMVCTIETMPKERPLPKLKLELTHTLPPLANAEAPGDEPVEEDAS